ncbi:cryptococcal mannosyltransferase 1-domain-containing protein [Triangularia verruculosa]|uniref:Cryptococcal mannosyltransferase 1-domain-containing protein n=1 Tax=Triangularia verruculosa TaxID=2587418 RepID=A0AAN6X901_9PEZI|nr:cryptococcal mannosyltransferase 1-domain-containing protein [Triangularia verruculosa]
MKDNINYDHCLYDTDSDDHETHDFLRRSSWDSHAENLSRLHDKYVSPTKPYLLKAQRFWSRLRLLRRTAWRRTPRPVILLLKTLLAFIASILILTPIFLPSYSNPPIHYSQLTHACRGTNPKSGCANLWNEQVFIATILYDKNGKLASGPFADRLLKLIHLLGHENVFLSIYENDSGVKGKEALEKLKARIPCKNSIVSDEHVSLDDFPTVTLPDGTKRVKRVAYLAELRNRALRPLDKKDYQDRITGVRTFDKVLYLNDIVFDPVEAAQLLFSTNVDPATGRPSYVAACAMDFWFGHRMYDTYAMRDADGYASYQAIYPFFGGRGRGLSRRDVLDNKDAVRVKSCWGGMMAMQAKYVQNNGEERPEGKEWEEGVLAGHVIDPENNTVVMAPPVRFRHEPGVFYDACECCLFSADLTQAARKVGDLPDGSKMMRGSESGIFVNPYVRVAYEEAVFKMIHWVRPWEKLIRVIYDLQYKYFEPVVQNPWRTVDEGEEFEEEVWNGSEWEVRTHVGRPGLFCGVREMQVLRLGGKRHKHGGNWVNTRMPPGQKMSFRSEWAQTLSKGWREEYEQTKEEDKETFFYRLYPWDV